MRFPQELWDVITDLKRHNPLRAALNRILARTEITHIPQGHFHAYTRNDSFIGARTVVHLNGTRPVSFIRKELGSINCDVYSQLFPFSQAAYPPPVSYFEIVSP